ncbi:hypothetical protein RZS28_14700 [Methylocapsa polymorpha]|uniref:Uncharacterized protein n=1 Tax=Methylocapsa polymorpha TaxID=3080828 RepID=A0ABZ0HQI6_9HYPH|nr:hypothetical protein RZS28_14700 [Methylocapsa sp. RX1]
MKTTAQPSMKSWLTLADGKSVLAAMQTRLVQAQADKYCAQSIVVSLDGGHLGKLTRFPQRHAASRPPTLKRSHAYCVSVS